MFVDDGIIRMHKGYDSAYPELITAWTAMADLLPTGGYSGPVQTRFAATRGRNTGLVMDWQQSVGCLILSGCITQIKVWDAEREVCAQDIPTASAFGSTALTSEKYAGHLLVSGFSDGVVRVYDRRAALSNW